MYITIAEIIIIFVLPVWLLHRGVIPVKYRLPVLVVFSLLIASIIYVDQTSGMALGIRTDNIKSAIAPYIIFTAVGAFALFILARIVGYKIRNNLIKDPHFQGLFIPISVLQVFAYRSFLLPKLTEVFPSAVFIIVASALLFAYLHIIYPNRRINLPVTFAGGLWFAYLYYYYQNFYLMSISHIILNPIAVMLGFVTFQPKDTKSAST